MLVEMRDLDTFHRDQGLGIYDAIIGAAAGLIGAGLQVGGAIVGSKGQEKVDQAKFDVQQALAKSAAQKAPYQQTVDQLTSDEKNAQLMHLAKLAGMIGGTFAGIYLINKAMK